MNSKQPGAKCEEQGCDGVPWWNGRRCSKHVPVIDLVVNPVESVVVTLAKARCGECGYELNVPREALVALSQGGEVRGECPRCRVGHNLQLSTVHVAKGVRERFGLRAKT